MTFFEKWQSYNDGLPTPDSMVAWSWYSLIATFLQRRVWLGPTHKPLFASNYVFFVSPPGIGKSLIIDTVDQFVRHWKHGDNMELLNAKFESQSEKTRVEVVVEADGANAEKLDRKSQSSEDEVIKPYLIPIAADATTYEALVLSFGKCYRRINFKEYNEKAEKDVIGVYGHSSLCFLLKELGSLLRKRTNDTVTLLLGLYDCPTDYEYDTVTREKDRIRRGCLNILGATNPSFMNQIFDEKLIDPAFLSRSIFVYASKNRKSVSEIPPLTKEQMQYGEDIKQHLLKLSTLYGLVNISQDTRDAIHKWFCHHEEHPESRSSKNPKLTHYYSRKLVHMKKLAMSMHFGESTEMEIPLETFKKAIEVLDQEEKFMHLALALDAKDKGAIMSRKIQELLREREMNFVEIYMELYESLGMVDKKVLEESIDFLYETHQINRTEKVDSVTGNQVNYWRIA